MGSDAALSEADNLLRELGDEDAYKKKSKAASDAARQAELAGRAGKGAGKLYDHFCGRCHLEWKVEMLECSKCGQLTVTREERHAELAKKVDALREEKTRRQQRRAAHARLRSAQRARKQAGTNYEAWALWDEDSGADDDEDGVPPTPDTPEFRAMELDFEKRAAARRAREKVSAEWKAKGNVAVKAGRHQEAVEHYSRAIEEVKGNKVLYTNRAVCHAALGDFAAARKDCNTALEIFEYLEDGAVEGHRAKCGDRIAFKAYLRRAAAEEALGRTAAAVADFARAAEIFPKDATAARMLAAAREKLHAQRDQEAVAAEATAATATATAAPAGGGSGKDAEPRPLSNRKPDTQAATEASGSTDSAASKTAGSAAPAASAAALRAIAASVTQLRELLSARAVAPAPVPAPGGASSAAGRGEDNKENDGDACSAHDYREPEGIDDGSATIEVLPDDDVSAAGTAAAAAAAATAAAQAEAEAETAGSLASQAPLETTEAAKLAVSLLALSSSLGAGAEGDAAADKLRVYLRQCGALSVCLRWLQVLVAPSSVMQTPLPLSQAAGAPAVAVGAAAAANANEDADRRTLPAEHVPVIEKLLGVLYQASLNAHNRRRLLELEGALPLLLGLLAFEHAAAPQQQHRGVVLGVLELVLSMSLHPVPRRALALAAPVTYDVPGAADGQRPLQQAVTLGGLLPWLSCGGARAAAVRATAASALANCAFEPHFKVAVRVCQPPVTALLVGQLKDSMAGDVAGGGGGSYSTAEVQKRVLGALLNITTDAQARRQFLQDAPDAVTGVRTDGVAVLVALFKRTVSVCMKTGWRLLEAPATAALLNKLLMVMMNCAVDAVASGGSSDAAAAGAGDKASELLDALFPHGVAASLLQLVLAHAPSQAGGSAAPLKTVPSLLRLRACGVLSRAVRSAASRVQVLAHGGVTAMLAVCAELMEYYAQGGSASATALVEFEASLTSHEFKPIPTPTADTEAAVGAAGAATATANDSVVTSTMLSYAVRVLALCMSLADQGAAGKAKGVAGAGAGSLTVVREMQAFKSSSSSSSASDTNAGSGGGGGATAAAVKVDGLQGMVTLLSHPDVTISGNAALLISSAARHEAAWPSLSSAVVPLITIMKAGNAKNGRNAAIACARLAKAPGALQQIRANQGMELMYRMVQAGNAGK